MSTENKSYPIVQDLIDSFAGWLKHRRELREMREMDRFNFDRIASDLRVTVSIGVAARRREDANLEALIARADRGLYAAKGAGRNRVEAGED